MAIPCQEKNSQGSWEEMGKSWDKLYNETNILLMH